VVGLPGVYLPTVESAAGNQQEAVGLEQVFLIFKAAKHSVAIKEVENFIGIMMVRTIEGLVAYGVIVPHKIAFYLFYYFHEAIIPLLSRFSRNLWLKTIKMTIFAIIPAALAM
jgi:hypothetical protein